MTVPSTVDAVLVQWGERLFYPGNRIVRSDPTPRLTALSVGQRAATVRARLEATVRRAPQVMVKVTGGGRGMKAIAAHFRTSPRPADCRSRTTGASCSKERTSCATWSSSGATAARRSRRRARDVKRSTSSCRCPAAPPLIVQRAAREFAQAELAEHGTRWCCTTIRKPHVDSSVRADRGTAGVVNRARPTCSAARDVAES